jgi:GntR family transcriptional regulator
MGSSRSSSRRKSSNVSSGIGRSQPLYQRIENDLARQIRDGVLRPGTVLPAELILAKQFGVSRQTMRAALDALTRAGLIVRERGRGTTVRRPPVQQSLARFYSIAHEARSQGRALVTRVLSRGRLSEREDWAQRACTALDLSDPSQVGYLLRLRLLDEEPLLLETITFPVTLCRTLLESPTSSKADPAAEPFYDTLAACAGIRVSEAHETFRPLAVDGYEARLLHVPPGTAVFAVERSSVADNRPVEWRRSLIRGDRYTYAVDLLNPDEMLSAHE